MQWMDIQKDWKTLSRSFATKWPKLTDADLKAIGGKRDELVARLARHYEKDEARLGKEVDEFVKTLKVKT